MEEDKYVSIGSVPDMTLERRVLKLELVLQLTKEMMIANDLILPHTFALIDDALNGTDYARD